MLIRLQNSFFQVMQNMLEALIRYDVIEEDEIAGSAESIVTVDTLWQLFNKVEEKLAESTANQNKELLEVSYLGFTTSTINSEAGLHTIHSIHY